MKTAQAQTTTNPNRIKQARRRTTRLRLIQKDLETTAGTLAQAIKPAQQNKGTGLSVNKPFAGMQRAWWVGETIRDLSYLKPWQLFVFWKVQLPLLKIFFKLGLPCLEVPFDLDCPHCGEKVEIENGGSWKEAISICTSRQHAVELCQNHPARFIDWLPINQISSEETARTGDFSVPAHDADKSASELVAVNRSELASIHSDLMEASNAIRSLAESGEDCETG